MAQTVIYRVIWQQVHKREQVIWDVAAVGNQVPKRTKFSPAKQ